MQCAEFFDQEFPGGELQLEVERALHEDSYGVLRGHGIHLPWECFLRHPLSLVISSSENVRANLIEKKGGTFCGGGKATFSGYCFSLVDTIEEMQHTVGAISTVSGQSWPSAALLQRPLSRKPPRPDNLLGVHAKKIFFAVFMLVVILCIGTSGYMLIEHGSFLDSLYMSVITITTLGYGEILPLSPAGRVFWWCLASMSISRRLKSNWEP